MLAVQLRLVGLTMVYVQFAMIVVSQGRAMEVTNLK